ncbi:MAG: hypothetical protein ABIR26_19490 [Ramlibacter sp.]
MSQPDPSKELHLQRELLRVVLRDTLKKTGVPPQWIGGETSDTVDESGKRSIEVRLILEADEPRFLYYLAAFQAEFESRLLAVDPKAWNWVARISWSLATKLEAGDSDFAMPTPEYWQYVIRDRHLTARQQGRLDWDQETLERHFEDTDPNVLDFDDTRPPEMGVEDIRPGDSKY